MSNQVELIGVYDYNEGAILVEMIINETSENIDFAEFCVPDDKLDESNRQIAYMEQYLNLDGTAKLCDVHDTPTVSTNPTRIAFFLFKTDSLRLSTPYGEFSIERLENLPDRLAKIIEFENFD
jgi:hypothetical protein